MAKVECPKCGGRATDNAQGTDHVWCRSCGGLVPKDYVAETIVHRDPARNAQLLEVVRPAVVKRVPWCRTCGFALAPSMDALRPVDRVLICSRCSQHHSNPRFKKAS